MMGTRFQGPKQQHKLSKIRFSYFFLKEFIETTLVAEIVTSIANTFLNAIFLGLTFKPI